MVERKYSWIAITSLVLVILGLVLFLFYLVAFALVFMILAIMFGVAGLRNIKDNKELKGKILAWVGIILGFLFTLIMVLLPKTPGSSFN